MSLIDTKTELALKQLLALNEEIEAAKNLYELRDQLVVTLQRAGFTEATFDGRLFSLKDNFAEKNTAWRMAAVNRFEIKVTKEK